MKRPSLIPPLLALFGGITLVIVLISSISSQSSNAGFEPHELVVDSGRGGTFPATGTFPVPRDPLPAVADSDPMCLLVYTGNMRSTFTISNPNGISGLNNYQLANFEQRLLSQSSTALQIEVVTRAYVDTRAPYPLEIDALPEEIRTYLLPEAGWIQSDDPQIVAKAQELISGATTQAEAIDAIQTWVRGNIAYDYTFSLPADASSVFRNQSGVCAGFSSLTVALIRAAGFPARYHSGCVAKYHWVVGDEGGWHAWIEVYFPDVGWVASDPQVTANFVDTSHIFAGFDQCGRSGTVIARTSHEEDYGPLYALRTPYVDPPRPRLLSADIPSWDRHPLRAEPASLFTILPIANPVGTVGLKVQNLSCDDQNWEIRTEVPWLGPAVVTGTTPGMALMTINATGMSGGVYRTAVMLYGSSWWWGKPLSRTLHLDLWLADSVHQLYIPFLAKGE